MVGRHDDITCICPGGRGRSEGDHQHLRMLVQEEQKVAILRAKLEEMGIDVDSLLEAVGDEEDEPHED